MAESEMRENSALLDHFVKRQHKIARNTEDFAGTMLLEGVKEGLGKFGDDGPPALAS